MRSIIIVVLVILSFGLSVVNAKEAKGEDVLADVNGTKITMSDFEKEISNMPENYKAVVNANKRKYLDELILSELLFQEAVKTQLDKDKDILSDLEKFRKRLLAQKLIEKVVLEGTVVSEEEEKKYYEEHKNDFRSEELVNAAHILIKGDAEDESKDKEAMAKAEGLLKKINEGGDFATLAKENSDCPSKEKGGELGFVSRGRMVPEFEEAAFKLKAGEMSGIVKTKFGYHIIKALDRMEEKQKEFDEVKKEIQEKLLDEKRRNTFNSYTEELKKKADITVNEALLSAKAESAE